MALYSDGTPSIDNRNPDESLVSANPQCEEQGTTRSGLFFVCFCFVLLDFCFVLGFLVYVCV